MPGQCQQSWWRRYILITPGSYPSTGNVPGIDRLTVAAQGLYSYPWDRYHPCSMRPKYKFDYEELLKVLLPLMEQIIKSEPAVIPVGVSMALDGKCSMTAGYTGEGVVNLDEVETLVLASFRSLASKGQLRASALGYSCSIMSPKLGGKTPVLAVKFEHVEGPPETLYRPYKKGWFGTRFSNIILVPGTPDVFAKPDDTTK